MIKDERYQRIDEKSKIITDALGCKIDKGIRELIVLLNYYYIGTTSSCWGHKNWGLNYPWIDIKEIYLEKFKMFSKDMNFQYEIIKNLDTNENYIRILPKDKNLKTGRNLFNKLKQILKQIYDEK